jgi:hypothetical protein
MLFGQGPNQRVLDQVVGPLDISGKHSRIAAQPRNLFFKKAIKIGHRFSQATMATLGTI